MPNNMTFTVNSDLNGESPQFTLNCTSTGGPATTVNWTRDSEAVSGGMTVLDDPVNATYTHTLTVTGRLGGQYQCTVSNDKPSNDSASFTVQGKRESKERAREGDGTFLWGVRGLVLIQGSGGHLAWRLYSNCMCLFVSLSSSGLSSHYPHSSPGRSHWYPSLLDPTHSTGGYNWVQDLL